MKTTRRQVGSIWQRTTVFSPAPNVLAGPREKQRLLKGLERFANTGESLEEYQALRRAWPGFWPIHLFGEGRDLAWTVECHRLFLFYRDALREVWKLGPRARLGYLPFLLGMMWSTFSDKPPVGVDSRLHSIWAELKQKHPTLEALQLLVVRPIWARGSFIYCPTSTAPRNEFQIALFVLFRESWRAKVCPGCSTFLVAEKSAQLYCSPECSNAAHRASLLKWWRAVGASKRARRRRPARRRNRKGNRWSKNAVESKELRVISVRTRRRPSG